MPEPPIEKGANQELVRLHHEYLHVLQLKTHEAAKAAGQRPQNFVRVKPEDGTPVDIENPDLAEFIFRLYGNTPVASAHFNMFASTFYLVQDSPEDPQQSFTVDWQTGKYTKIPKSQSEDTNPKNVSHAVLKGCTDLLGAAEFEEEPIEPERVEETLGQAREKYHAALENAKNRVATLQPDEITVGSGLLFDLRSRGIEIGPKLVTFLKDRVIITALGQDGQEVGSTIDVTYLMRNVLPEEKLPTNSPIAYPGIINELLTLLEKT